MTFPQRSEGVGVVEGDATLLKVKAHAEPGRQRVGEARGRGGAVAVGDGVSDAVPVAAVVVLLLVVMVVVLGQVDLTHPHSEEAEWWSGVQSVLCSAVMTTVWVVAGDTNNHYEGVICLFFIYYYPPWQVKYSDLLLK